MKPTAITALLASLPSGRRLALTAAFVTCGLTMFLVGRASAPTPDDMLLAVQSMRLQVLQQQGAVDRLAKGNRHGRERAGGAAGRTAGRRHPARRPR
jgi:hypothetical protein